MRLICRKRRALGNDGITWPIERAGSVYRNPALATAPCLTTSILCRHHSSKRPFQPYSIFQHKPPTIESGLRLKFKVRYVHVDIDQGNLRNTILLHLLRSCMCSSIFVLYTATGTDTNTNGSASVTCAHSFLVWMKKEGKGLCEVIISILGL